MRWFLSATLLGCLPLAGCFAPNSPTSQGESLELEPETLPAGQCDTDPDGEDCETEAAPDPSGDTPPGDGVDACENSEDCSGGYCVADFDAETLERGASECGFACVATLSDTQWCVDAAACCDPQASCTDRGYCVVSEEDATGTGSSTGDATGSGTGTTGGAETDSATETDPSTGSDSSGTGT